ncbi:MAG: methyltransferase domain-containing protein [Phycisphaerales bacterium]|nr:methyltransferase domain-containing protein [Phycisphaerales bacterium]
MPAELEGIRFVAFVDMVGYSKLREQIDRVNPGRASDQLRRQMDKFFERGCREAGVDAREVTLQQEGDGDLLCFSEAVQVYHFAEGFFAAVRESNQAAANRVEVRRFRMGATCGHIQTAGGTRQAEPIVRARRLQEAAEPDHLLVSPSIFDQLLPEQQSRFGCLETVKDKEHGAQFIAHRRMFDTDFSGAKGPQNKCPACHSEYENDRATCDSCGVHVARAQQYLETFNVVVQDGHVNAMEQRNLDHLISELKLTREQAERIESAARGSRSVTDANCFVILPVGDEGTPTRKRSDYVFEQFIVPACQAAGFRKPHRADRMSGKSINEDIMNSLKTAEMVVAYLGSPDPDWNANVMLEVGYRMALEQPIVVVRDKSPTGAGVALPFSIHHTRFAEIPAGEVPDHSVRNQSVKRIGELMDAECRRIPTLTESPVPSVVVRIDLTPTGNHKLLEGSSEAERLFGFPLRGESMERLFTQLQKMMPQSQFDPFVQEQDHLLRTLVPISVPFSVYSIKKPRMPLAKVPIVIESHARPEYCGRAYLPVIVRSTLLTGEMQLRVLYLEVTSKVERTDGHYTCCFVKPPKITGWEQEKAWHDYARSYDRVLPELPFYREVVDRHVAYLTDGALPSRGRILDLGAGTGNVAIRLMQAGWNVTAVDASWSMLEHLRKKVPANGPPRMEILQRQAECLWDLDDEIFDGVNILLSLYDMQEPREALFGAMRLLRSGGRMIVTEPKSSFKLQPLLEAGERHLREKGKYDTLQADWERVMQANRDLDPVSPRRSKRLWSEDVKRLLDHSGFEETRIEDSHLGNCASVSGRKSRNGTAAAV